MLCAALFNCFEYTAETIRTQVRVFDHAESLIQPFDNAHSINWLLGHIVSARTTPLGLLGAENVWSDACRARYRHGSSPINCQDESVLRIENLLSLFNKTHCLLQAGYGGWTKARC